MKRNWISATIFLFVAIYGLVGCQTTPPVSVEAPSTTQITEQTQMTEESVTEETEVTEAPTEVTEPEGIQEDKILPMYLSYYRQNQDMVGWIRMPGTQIYYPVMQTGLDNANYYLDKDFDHQTTIAGAIYVREFCDVFRPSDNVVIYGHNMRDESMFGSLGRFREQSYWQNNQYVYFDNLYESHVYQIFAVFAISADPGNFPYHEYNDFASQEEFEEFIQIVTNHPDADPAITGQFIFYYDTGIRPEYGDKLITLSTCTKRAGANGRMVLIAYRVS